MSTAKNGMTDQPRDEQIARAYRDAVDDDPATAHPPAALDEAIRAAARQAAHAGPETLAVAARRADTIAKRGFLRRWQTPLAAAATLALAVGVAIKVYDSGEADFRSERSQAMPSPPMAAPAPESTPAVAVEKGDSTEADRAPVRDTAPRAQAESKVIDEFKQRPPAVSTRPERASKPTADSTAPPPGTPLPEEMVAKRKEAVTAELERPKAREDSVTSPSIASTLPAPAAAPPVAQAGASASLRSDAPRQRSANTRFAMEAEPAPFASRSLNQLPERRAVMEDRMAPGSAVSTLIAQLATRPVDAWIEEIRALKRAGRIADANTLRSEFQKRFPDTRLPDDLR